MTLCPQCHLENREGRRFCSKCAAPLAVVCAARRRVNAATDSPEMAPTRA
jgi:predicted amidophosphoribosyltransferase